MTVRKQIAKFLWTYLVFVASTMVVNVTLELLLGHPAWGIVGFYALFSILGSLVLHWKRLKPLPMGMLSLAAGWFCELTFMKPDFLQDVHALRISARLIFTLVITSLYWFLAWGVPTWIVHRYFKNEPC